MVLATRREEDNYMYLVSVLACHLTMKIYASERLSHGIN